MSFDNPILFNIKLRRRYSQMMNQLEQGAEENLRIVIYELWQLAPLRLRQYSEASDQLGNLGPESLFVVVSGMIKSYFSTNYNPQPVVVSMLNENLARAVGFSSLAELLLLLQELKVAWEKYLVLSIDDKPNLMGYYAVRLQLLSSVESL